MSNDEARQPARTLALGRPAAARPPKPDQVEVPATLGAPRRSLGATSETTAAPLATATLATRSPAPTITPEPLAQRVEATPERFEPPTTLVTADRSPVVTAPRIRAAAPMHDELTKPLSEVIARRDHQNLIEMFRDLVKVGVSDVHIERSKLRGDLRIEARVDGKMQLVHTYTGVQAQTIHTKLKTDSEMSSGVNYVPEDGSYEIPIDGYPYRARAAVLPLFDGGEKVTFRLPQTGALRKLDELGLTERNLVATRELLDVPGGMVLFAGPTGEGKSTTALSSLMYLREKEEGVFITLEDPVERIIPGFSQVEVREEIAGAGFGDMMKFIVRSDPNVLFVGEIRDAATATAAVEIAKSGIRVVATIHATNNISAFMRLIGMADADPLSVLESVNGIVSQRLVPRLVPGTSRFHGRYPVHEITKNSEHLTDALIANASRASISSAAAATSTTFQENVDELVAAGITTLAEAKKVVRHV